MDTVTFVTVYLELATLSQLLSFPLKRAFIALPLEGQAKEAFREVQERLQPFSGLFRFQNPDNPHLTLYFWSELMEIEYGDILKKIEAIAARTKPFVFRVMEATTFNDRVLVLAIARSQELSALKKLCPWPNTKPFAPHITLTRMRNPDSFRVKEKRIMKLLRNVEFDVSCDRLRFYAEIGGVQQTPVGDFPLRGIIGW